MKNLSRVAFASHSIQGLQHNSRACYRGNYISFCSNRHFHSQKPLRQSTLALGSDVASESVLTSSAIDGQPSGVYEAVMPQTETLVGMGFILILCIALYWVWENQVVPVSRTKLAISKSRGEVKEYLDELKASSQSTTAISSEQLSSDAMSSELEFSKVETSVDSSTTKAVDQTLGYEVDSATASPASEPQARDRAFERWLFTDWLEDNKSERKAGRQKEPALPILKDAKWNSGDNPVVVAAFLMMVGLIFTSFTERLASLG